MEGKRMNMSIFQFFEIFRKVSGFLVWFFFFLPIFDLFSQDDGMKKGFAGDSIMDRNQIFFQEGLLNHPSFFVNGQRMKGKEVKSILSEYPEINKEFKKSRTFVTVGQVLQYSKIVTFTGLGVFFLSIPERPKLLSLWIYTILGSGITQSTTSTIPLTGIFGLENSINQYNALQYSDSTKPYYRVRFEDDFWNTQTKYFADDLQINKGSLLERLRENPDAFRTLEKAIRREQFYQYSPYISGVFTLGVMAALLNRNSSLTQKSNVTIPIFVAGMGFQIFSSHHARKTRNMTRRAIYLYNTH